MNDEHESEIERQEHGRGGYRRGRGHSRSAGRAGRETAADPGAAFASEVLERLAAMKKDDRASFEALRAQLKSAGCRVTALDEAIAEEREVLVGAGRHRPTY